MTARGGTDWFLLSSVKSRISQLLMVFNRGWLRSKLRLRTKNGRSPNFPRLKFVSFIICLFCFGTSANAAWIFVPDAFMANPSGKVRFFDPVTALRTEVFFTPAQVLAGGFAINPLTLTASNLNIVAPFPALNQSLLNAAAAQSPIVTAPPAPVVNGATPVVSIYPFPNDPLNPANAVLIGSQFAEYASYMLGISVLGLFLGMSFGGILGLIRPLCQGSCHLLKKSLTA